MFRSMTEKQHKALSEIKRRLLEIFNIEKLILYGSAARGEAEPESDQDLLVVTSAPLTRFERHKITDAVFEVNLSFNTNFSTLVTDHDSWESGIISVLPLHDEIMKEGICL